MNELIHLLAAHGLVLPTAPTPVGAYLATTHAGKWVYISGQLPIRDGKLLFKGQIGEELTVEEGYAAAELCALNLLSQFEKHFSFNKLRQVIKIEGFINCCEGFDAHATVLNGASDLLSKILGDRAGHTRAVMGCTSLPLGAAIEVAAIVELE